MGLVRVDGDVVERVGLERALCALEQRAEHGLQENNREAEHVKLAVVSEGPRQFTAHKAQERPRLFIALHSSSKALDFRVGEIP